MMIKYTVMRHVDAVNDQGLPCQIAIALVQHENGVCQRVAINEGLIRFAGEDIIAREVMAAAAVPASASIVHGLNHWDRRDSSKALPPA